MSLLETESRTEPKRVKIGDSRELIPGSSKVVVVGDHNVAVFNIDGVLYAIDDSCPHRGASLAQGSREGTVVTCPLHQWQFDLRTGKCLKDGGHSLRRFELFRAGDSLLLDIGSMEDEDAETWDGIYRYLVRYGAMGWVGRFGSVDRIDCSHGDRVVLQTGRGMEVGTILAEPTDENGEKGSARPVGEVLRGWTAEDELKTERPPRSDLDKLFAHSQKLLADRRVDIEVVDCERLFDGETTVLYYLGEVSADTAAIAEELAETWQETVLFDSVIEPTPPLSGSSGCGGGGGGCSSGGCDA